MEKLISKSFERLMDKGLNRGFITHEELKKSLGKRNSNTESLNKALLHIFDQLGIVGYLKYRYQKDMLGIFDYSYLIHLNMIKSKYLKKNKSLLLSKKDF